jgi:stage IV sporulation protein FB
MIIPEPNRTPWDLKWRMFNIPVRVHPAFWFVTLCFSYISPEEQRSIARNLSVIPFSLVLITMACMFVSVLVHEFGHALCGRYYGDKNHTVLYMMGGLCVSERGAVPERWPRINQLLWGPGAGFILAVAPTAAYFALRYGYVQIENMYVVWLILQLMWINLVWGLMNLLPVYPLDGGQICREIIRWKASNHGDLLSLTISFYTAIGVSIAFVGYLIYRSSQGYSFDVRQLWPILLFLSLAYTSFRARQQVMMYGEMESYPSERREAWERDPDWWKHGGR